MIARSAKGVTQTLQLCVPVECKSLLAVEVGIGLVLDEKHIDNQRDRYARGHVGDEHRHLIAFLKSLVDQRRGAAEDRVRRCIADSDTKGAHVRGNSSDLTSALIEQYPVRIT